MNTKIENQITEVEYKIGDGEVLDFSTDIYSRINHENGSLESCGYLHINDLHFEFSPLHWEQFKKMIANS